MKSFGMLLGRWFIAAIFLVAAVQKVFNWDATSSLMASKGLEMVPAFLAAAIALEIFAALALITGSRTRLSATLLALFLIPVTILFHDFWAVPAGDARELQQVMFFKNCAILGGLFYIISTGPGRMSRDHRKIIIKEQEEEAEES